MRDKVLAIIHDYAEQGRIRDVIEHHGISVDAFYGRLAAEPELMTRYRAAQISRADFMADEIISIADDDANAPRARNRIDARKWLAGVFDRARFGDKIDMSINGQVSIAGALLEAKQRGALPGRNLGQVIETEYELIPSVAGERATDKQSDAPAGFVDPFADD